MDSGIITLTISLLILLISVIVHEVMHGYVALKFGDHTAENAGRLTLNPIPHIDPVGTILLPALLIVLPLLTGIRPGFFIGWAKPVPVNPLHFSDIKKGELLVSLAGIGANFVLAIFGALLFHLTLNFGANETLLEVFQFTVAINLTLAFFNLLPIPPLDGSKALLSQLPYHLAKEYEKIGQYGFLIIIGLIYFNVIGLLLNFFTEPFFSILGVPSF